MRYFVVLSVTALVGACAKGSMPLGPEDDDEHVGTGGAGGTGGAEPLSFGGTDGIGGDPNPACPTGLLLCGGSCVDVTESPAHCGGCHAPCATGQTCVGGSCVAGSMTTTSTTTSTASSSAASSGAGGGSTGCHPLNPAAACGPSSHCVPQTTGIGQCLAPAGFGTQYSGCFGPADCAPIYDCITTPYATTYCMQWCTSDVDCLGYPSDLCVGLDPPLFAQGYAWGVCYDGLP